MDDKPAEHPLAEYVIAAITAAQGAGQVRKDADAAEFGVIFMTGLFALLSTAEPDSRGALLDRYVKTLVHGMETR